jgi:hypothetical protein
MSQPTSGQQSAVTRWLERASPAVFAAWAIAAAFTTYFCMYSFRKPFGAATFEDAGAITLVGLSMNYKILLIISQVVGYCLSKFIGIKVISEMGARWRAWAIVGILSLAELALVLFALIPQPWNALAMFLNGLPLGMVWGLVFGFLEGRKLSELLGAGLSASYIVASGAVKTVGVWIMDAGVSEYWMPAAVGLLFYPVMLGSVWMLSRLPPPSAEDEAARTRRQPMDGPTRMAFLMRFAPGLISLTGLYVLLTAYRDFRDNFAREIWIAIGYEEAPEIMTTSELPIAAGVLLTLALIMVIRSNRKALLLIHGIMLAGTALIGLSTAAYQAGVLPPAAWMILVGLGMYIAYVPYGCVLFDRLIAAVGFVATAGFMIYVTDASGYLGSVMLLLYKNFGQADLSWLDFFIGFSYTTSVVCTALFVASLVYFERLTRSFTGPGGEQAAK